ncbi:MAG TPA: cyclic nucleotide-binding domain-containing protein [Nitrospirales bacterium]|jgi:CRP-like cAMP-binding protein
MGLIIAQVSTDADKEKMFAFRYRIYVEELGFMLPDADHPRKRLWDPLDDVATSYMVLDNQEVVGSLRIVFLQDVPDPTSLIHKFAMRPAIAAMGEAAICTTSRFIIHPGLRRSLAILHLMEAGYRHAVERGVRLNYGDCSPHLLPFYEHLGYRRYTYAYNDITFGFKFPILMLLDRQHLAEVRSPLTRVAARYADDEEARRWFQHTYPDYLKVESALFMGKGMFFNHLCARVAIDPLHDLKVLHGLKRQEADLLLARATVIQALAGDRILRQGELGEALFVVLSGIVEVIVTETPDQPSTMRRAGDAFGEMSFTTPKPQPANFIAKTSCEILVLPVEFLRYFMSTEPKIYAKVLRNLLRDSEDHRAVYTVPVAESHASAG